MCTDCRAEYENVLDRRFHAQPIACPQCGPQITLLDKDGIEIAARDKALLIAAQKLRAGQILGLKGIGGFQILVNASSEDAVRELRLRKRREEKPFAVMFPTLEMAEDSCNIGDLERRLLRSAQSPIVIVEAKESSQLARSVAPGNPDVGIMIPYSPLHHLLLEAAGIPVVATSGNLSEEPICIDEREAISALSGIVDFYLVHNRPIARHVDDSVVRIIAGRETVLRRARGYAPLPLPLGSSYLPFLAVGAHQKSTIALSVDSSAVVSQHIGDLDTLGTWNVFNRVINDLSRMYDHKPVAIACDLHPDYRSTSYAAASGLNVLKIQHHYAHILSCMADNHLTGDVLGLAWDGTGYGADGTIWGGEFLTVSDSGYSRHARLFPFRLPGGESAVHEPRRTALGLLYAAMGNGSLTQCDIAVIRTFTKRELQNISTMLHNGLNSPVTSSMGRLFDGIAAIAGVRYQVRHEGQAAMQLEYLARGSDDIASYELPLVSHLGILTADWRPMIWEIIRDLEFGVSLEDIARRFHNSLAELAVAAARSAGIERVVMSGGCFQNRLLTEACINGLRDAGFTPYWHQRTPPNDGGIALGQLVGAGRALAIQTRISVKVL
jgi:hydrogenase maturation protein HypF